ALQSDEQASKRQRLERITPAGHAANQRISLRSPSGPSRSPHRAPLVLRLGRLGTAQASDRKHLVLCLSNCAEVAAATRNFDLKHSVPNRYRGRNGLLTSEFRLKRRPWATTVRFSAGARLRYQRAAYRLIRCKITRFERTPWRRG